jgi:hypothetical protein
MKNKRVPILRAIPIILPNLIWLFREVELRKHVDEMPFYVDFHVLVEEQNPVSYLVE